MLATSAGLRDGRARRPGGAEARWILLALAAASLAACAGGPRPLESATRGAPTSRYAGYKVGKPYQVRGVWYYPKDQPDYDEIGLASWYGDQFHNHYTADGEVFDMRLPSAAHKTLPLPSLVEVTNLANGRTLVVRVNDRGPFIDGRVIDLSREAAAELGFVAAGITRVRVRYVGHAPDPPDQRLYLASKTPPAPAAISTPAPPIRLAQQAAPFSAAPQGQVDHADDPSVPSPAPAHSYAAAPVQQTPLAATPRSGSPSYIAPQQDEVTRLLADAPTVPVAAITPKAPSGFQVQAGVFSTRANAERLASRLSGPGAPQVEPFDRGGQTFYRVVVHGLSDPDAAAAARGQAAALGVADARVVSAF